MELYAILPLVIASLGIQSTAVQAEKAALIIIDVQNCFLTNGSFPVRNGDDVIPAINQIREEHGDMFSLVVLSQDWHCADHVSFASQHAGYDPLSKATLYYDNNGNLCLTPGISSPYAVNCTTRSHMIEQTLWPDHCVIGSQDAEFHHRLHREPTDIVVRKGYTCKVDSYSAFFDNGGFSQTELDSVLRAHMITSVYVTGLALDFCVYFTSVDANHLGYETYTVADAARGITPEGVTKAMADLRLKGVHVINKADINILSSADARTGCHILLVLTSALVLITFFLTS